MIRSLRGRVVLSVAAVTIAILGAFVAVVFFLFSDRLRSELDDSLRSYESEVLSAYRQDLSIPQPPVESAQLGAAILDEEGKVIDSTLPFEGELESREDAEGDGSGEDAGEEESEDGGSENEASRPSTTSALVRAASPDGSFVTVPGEHGTSLRAFVHRLDGSGRNIVIATLAPASSSGSPANRLLVISLIALTSAVIVVVAIAYWVGGLAVRPSRRLASEVHSLDERSLDERVSVPENVSEVAEVAAAVNTLLSRIEASVNRERAFVADASHELRNPLASLRGELELSSHGADPEKMQAGIEGAIEETDRLARLTDDLLLLARADAGNLQTDPLSLADVSSTAILRKTQAADAKGIELVLGGDDVNVLGNAVLVERAVENLLENSLRHAPQNSRIEVILWSNGTSGGVDVTDRGPGIPAADRERIFHRFGRVQTSRARTAGGTGLGLAIVASAMHAMGGEVGLVSGDPGHTTFRLSFVRHG